MVASSGPVSDSEARALEVALTDVVTAVLSDVPSMQPVVSTVSGQSLQTTLLMLEDFCVTVEWSEPTHLLAPLWLLTPLILLPSWTQLSLC